MSTHKMLSEMFVSPAPKSEKCLGGSNDQRDTKMDGLRREEATARVTQSKTIR